MRTFLLHGLGRTPASMTWLARRLRRAGHSTSVFGYLVLAADLDTIARRFTDRVAHELAADAARNGRAEPPPYAIIGHSLGGIIARLASPHLPGGLSRFVMMGPPNHPPAVARALGGNPLFRWLSGNAGAMLTSPEFYRRLPRPDVPTLVIAGDRGPSTPWLPFAGSPNDGIVRVAEARIPGVPLLVVHGAHTFLMNRRDAVRAVLQFLAAEHVEMPPAAPDRNEPVSAAAAPSPAPANSPGTGC